MAEVWRRPGAQALADLKECLDFGASSWLALFSRLGGADLLLQVPARPPVMLTQHTFRTKVGVGAVRSAVAWAWLWCASYMVVHETVPQVSR